MIVEAINKRTGKIVKIEEAYSGQRLICPYCGVEVHPVLEVATPFFRCYEGGKHTNYLCEQLEKGKRAYDPNLIDIEELFANLFRPVKECKPPVIPPVLPPDDGEEPEEKPETGELKPEPGMVTGVGPDETEGTGVGKGPDEGEDNSPEPVVLPCRTLSQLWKAGIYKLGAFEHIGSYVRSDVFLWYRDFGKYFARRDDLGKRVLAVRPRWPVNKSNAILFDSFSMDRETKVYKRKNFVLVFDDRKEYNQACKKLFVRNTESNGSSSTAPKYSMVLVAGDWTELDEEKYMAFKVETGDHCYGAQISNFSSKNQIYAIQEFKLTK